jgi:hypothetical protein
MSGSISTEKLDEVIAEFLRCGELEESVAMGSPYILLAIPNSAADSKYRGSYISPHGIKFFEDSIQIYHDIIMHEVPPEMLDRLKPLLDANCDIFNTFNFKLELDRQLVVPKVIGFHVWNAGRDGADEEEEMTQEAIDKLNASWPVIGLKYLQTVLPDDSFPRGYLLSGGVAPTGGAQ